MREEDLRRIVHVLNGPNLSLLGKRQPHIDGFWPVSDPKLSTSPHNCSRLRQLMVIAADCQRLSPSLIDARHRRRRPVEYAIDASARVTIAAAVLRGNEPVGCRSRQPVGPERRTRTLHGYYPKPLRVLEPQVARSGILQPAAADFSERRDYRGTQHKAGSRAEFERKWNCDEPPIFLCGYLS